MQNSCDPVRTTAKKVGLLGKRLGAALGSKDLQVSGIDAVLFWYFTTVLDREMIIVDCSEDVKRVRESPVSLLRPSLT